MTHFGMLCPALQGHLNPMLVLGKTLKQKGHQITFIQLSELEAKINSYGLDFYPLGIQDYPPGKLTEFLAGLGQLKGVAAVSYWHSDRQVISGIICRELKTIVEKIGIDVLLVDQLEPAAATVAEYLGIPFLTICNALVLNREPGIPPVFTTWSNQSSWLGKMRNRLFYYLGDRTVVAYNKVLAEYRCSWGLPSQTQAEMMFANSQIAQISQQPAVFDFPRQNLPPCFHYTGPWRNSQAKDIPFPYDKLNGKPLIYASLGTLQIQKYEIFHCIATACQDLDVQLVISHGGGMTSAEAEALPGSPLVVHYAPQTELFGLVKLVITHGGLNTVLDALSQGVPLLALPIAFEQPAIAARIRWLGVGDFLPLRDLNPQRLQQRILEVLGESSYRYQALESQKAIAASGGVDKAVEIIEQLCVSTGIDCSPKF